MYGWIARPLVRRAVEGINSGEVEPALSNFTEDATLLFPGDHSWEAEYQGKDEIERFLRRVVRVGLKFEIHDVFVKGPPWRMRACVRFSNKIIDPDGNVVYANSGVLYLKGKWGKIHREEVCEDTQKVAQLDEYLGVA
jgi:hypothetical protein